MKTTNTNKFAVEVQEERATVTRSAMYKNTMFIAATSQESGLVSLRGRKFNKSKLAVDTNENVTSRIQALAAVISTLEKGVPTEEGIFLIYTNSTLVDHINSASYRAWLATGSFKNGSKVSELELSLWDRFVLTYADCFERVEFRNISDCAIRVDGKAVEIDSDAFSKSAAFRQINHKLSSQAWDLVADTVGKYENNESARSVDSLEEVEEDGFEDAI